MANKLVVNVAAQIAASIFAEADEWAKKGHSENEQKALDAARAQLKLAGLDSREAAEMKACELVPLTAKEEEQHAQDKVDATARAQTLGAKIVERKALLSKLQVGEASPAEVQQALAKLLGGS